MSLRPVLKNKLLPQQTDYHLSESCRSIKEKIRQTFIEKRLCHLIPSLDGGNDAYAEVLFKDKSSMYSIYANSSISYNLNSIEGLKNLNIAYIPSEENQYFKDFIFRTTPKRDINSGDKPREHDTEYKIIEYICGLIQNSTTRYHLEKFTLDNIGEIKLYTRLEPCLSCDSVFINFNKTFPQIGIKVYYEQEYTLKHSSCKYF